MNLAKIIIDISYGSGLFINASLFIPQAIKIIRQKRSHDLSLITFIGFCLIQLAAVAYGYIQKDLIIMLGNLASFISCGLVTLLTAIFAWKHRTH